MLPAMAGIIAVSPLEGGSWIAPQMLLAVAVTALGGLFLWWIRERRLAEQRRGMRALYGLSEQILSARSPSEILHRLITMLPRVTEVGSVRLYLHERRTRSLERVPSHLDPQAFSLPLDSPAAPSLCFRNRALLAISDIRRSPFQQPVGNAEPPRSAMFIPMIVENETTGVLEIGYTGGIRQFSPDQQAAAQHLANQVATALKLLEQQSIREQLFRSEKLAAAGQLISGVANELQVPLETMAARAGKLLVLDPDSPLAGDLRAIASEARRAAEIVSRLVSFSRGEQTEAEPVDLNRLLSGLMEFREREWKVRGIKVRNLLSPEPLAVLGSRSHLEQVFLNLLVHAEQSLAEAPVKTITVGTRLLAKRVLAEIAYSAARQHKEAADLFPNGANGEAGALGLGVCRGIIQSHGGEIRLVYDTGGGERFQVELPVASAAPQQEAATQPEAVRNRRPLTALLVASEETSRPHLLNLLSGRGHRVVPVANAQEAADLVRRLRFDLVVCPVHLPGSNWIEFFQKVRHKIGAFVVLTEVYSEDLARALPPGQGHILHDPVDEAEFHRILASVEARAGRPPAAAQQG